MKIKLISLELKNFKGTKEQLINFGNATLIDGDNGTGKTTIEDAFFWLLFGKDSTDRKVFEVQPLDENNDIVHHLDTIVTGTLEIDGTIKVFKRTLKEKWQKKRGQAEQELTGNTTEYEIDDIPVKQKDYLSQISEIMDENNFKLLTNPLYFPNMDWKKQREILFEIIGDLSEESVINYNSKLKPLAELLSGKSIEEFNERIKATIKKLKDKVKDIPARIDENNSMICEEDFVALESEKEGIQAEINKIDEQIADLSKTNEGKLKLQEQLFELKNKLSILTSEAIKNANKPLEETKEEIYKIKSELQEVDFEIKTKERNRDNFNNTNIAQEKEIEELKIKKQNLLNEYHKVNDEVFEFNEKETICKCCGRPFEMDRIEEIKESARVKFEKNQKHNLDAIKSGGLGLKANIEKAELLLLKDKEEVEKIIEEISRLELKKSNLKTQLSDLEGRKYKLEVTQEIKVEGSEELKIQINEIQAQIEAFNVNDNTELKIKKNSLQDELSRIDKLLGQQQVNESLKARIEELREEEKQLNIQIAQLEKQQFLGEEFIRTKVELLEDTINRKFNGEVNFKLFSNQINGGLNETCVATINGVPFSDANSAAKINAGISILNTLCKHYGANAPVFIDNAESINDIRSTESQLILLKVSQNKNLQVNIIENNKLNSEVA